MRWTFEVYSSHGWDFATLERFAKALKDAGADVVASKPTIEAEYCRYHINDGMACPRCGVAGPPLTEAAENGKVR